jgi:hypothetical protein
LKIAVYEIFFFYQEGPNVTVPTEYQNPDNKRNYVCQTVTRKKFACSSGSAFPWFLEIGTSLLKKVYCKLKVSVKVKCELRCTYFDS